MENVETGDKMVPKVLLYSMRNRPTLAIFCMEYLEDV